MCEYEVSENFPGGYLCCRSILFTPEATNYFAKNCRPVDTTSRKYKHLAVLVFAVSFRQNSIYSLRDLQISIGEPP